MIWSQKPNLEQLNKLSQNTLCEHLGMVFTDIGDDFIVAKMPVDQRTKQPLGLLHGGASVALAESLGSIASAFCVDAAKKMPVGVEINANHLKSAVSGFVIGKVTPQRLGKNIHVWNIEIHNDKTELICVSRLTVMIIDKK
ncbi:MAG: hotdog fold thioesterase [Bdellovibrionota bacterium]